MFTGVYWVIKGFFCNICRENPVIFTDCRFVVYEFVVVMINKMQKAPLWTPITKMEETDKVLKTHQI